ncbi:MerR family DNA-binding transcriptional regulator [Desertimonas flava]|uniref:MerR family DNA-binding transcriptional regulator n=1 Tax=Desertimonas flava TaxID=2064846 RepID=UPI000E34D2D1|nr:MerR family DNA-binding transcriptional regulator [Desertimonas flava]
MTTAERTFTIGELAAEAGVGVETIRFYERQGILPEPPRSASGYRRYGDVDRWRLAFILRGKALGFSLRDIGELLGAESERSIADVLRVTAARLERVEQELAELASHRDRLRSLLRTCENGDGEACLALATPDPPTI